MTDRTTTHAHADVAELRPGIEPSRLDEYVLSAWRCGVDDACLDRACPQTPEEIAYKITNLALVLADSITNNDLAAVVHGLVDGYDLGDVEDALRRGRDGLSAYRLREVAAAVDRAREEDPFTSAGVAVVAGEFEDVPPGVVGSVSRLLDSERGTARRRALESIEWARDLGDAPSEEFATA